MSLNLVQTMNFAPSTEFARPGVGQRKVEIAVESCRRVEFVLSETKNMSMGNHAINWMAYIEGSSPTRRLASSITGGAGNFLDRCLNLVRACRKVTSPSGWAFHSH